MLMHGIHDEVFPLPQEMPALHHCSLPTGLPTSGGGALDMLTKLVLRPRKAAAALEHGLDREEEEGMLRWQVIEMPASSDLSISNE